MFNAYNKTVRAPPPADRRRARGGPALSATHAFAPRVAAQNFQPGQSSTICPTGVQFATAVDDVLGATPYMPGGKMAGSAFEYMMVDRLKVPQHLEPGDYVLSCNADPRAPTPDEQMRASLRCSHVRCGTGRWDCDEPSGKSRPRPCLGRVAPAPPARAARAAPPRARSGATCEPPA